LAHGESVRLASDLDTEYVTLPDLERGEPLKNDVHPEQVLRSSAGKAANHGPTSASAASS
jgi:hypothetical protein